MCRLAAAAWATVATRAAAEASGGRQQHTMSTDSPARASSSSQKRYAREAPTAARRCLHSDKKREDQGEVTALGDGESRERYGVGNTGSHRPGCSAQGREVSGTCGAPRQKELRTPVKGVRSPGREGPEQPAPKLLGMAGRRGGATELDRSLSQHPLPNQC